MKKKLFYWDIENIGLTYFESIYSKVSTNDIIYIFMNKNMSKTPKMSFFIKKYAFNENIEFIISDNNIKDSADIELEKLYLKNILNNNTISYCISNDIKLLKILNIDKEYILNRDDYINLKNRNMIQMVTNDNINSNIEDLNNEEYSGYFNNNKMYANLDLKLDLNTTSFIEIQNKLLEFTNINYIKKCFYSEQINLEDDIIAKKIIGLFGALKSEDELFIDYYEETLFQIALLEYKMIKDLKKRTLKDKSLSKTQKRKKIKLLRNSNKLNLIEDIDSMFINNLIEEIKSISSVKSKKEFVKKYKSLRLDNEQIKITFYKIKKDRSSNINRVLCRGNINFEKSVVIL